MAVRTRLFLQEFRHPFHAFFVLHMGQGIFHSVYSVKVRKIHFPGQILGLVMVQHVVFIGSPVEHQIFFLVRQVPEGHVRTDTQIIPGNILHKGPHEALPGSHGPFVNGQGIVGHQSRFVHSPADARTLAGLAGTPAVEGQVLCPRTIKMDAAHGTDQLLLCSHIERGGYVMAIRAAVAGQPGKHKAQAVQQLRAGAEGAADARDPGTLTQG